MYDSLNKTLAHHGIKGMKWGVRKRTGTASTTPSAPETVTIRKNKQGKLETSGGRGHSPAPDALKAAAYRQKARASGTHSLSNVELQTLVTRMNLEGQYSKLVAANAPPKGAGHQFLEKFLESEKNTLISGKKTKTQGFVEMIVKTQRGRMARKATSKAAQTVATKALVGTVVN